MLKFFKRFALYITLVLALSILDIAVEEYYGLRNARLDMACYMNIAADYAMSAVQDNTEIDQTNEYSKNLSQYNKDEYEAYLTFLSANHSVNYGTTNQDYLDISYDILQKSYNSLSSDDRKKNLDTKLEYKPLSLNLPYISISQVTVEYEYALEQILQNNISTKGVNIILANSSNYDTTNKYTIDNANSASYTVDSSNKVNVKYNSNNGSQYVGSYKNSTVCMNLSIATLDETTQRKLYGNTTTFSETLKSIQKELNSQKYKDIRYSGDYTDVSDTRLPEYQLQFYTEWYYVTQSGFLTVPSKNYGTTGNNGDYASTENTKGNGLFWNASNVQTYREDLNSGADINVYAPTSSYLVHPRSTNAKDTSASDSTANLIPEGQILLKVNNGASTFNITKEYMIIG